MDVCHHGRIRCWECARVQEMQERIDELERAIREALGRMKHGGAGTRTYVQHVLEKVLEVKE
ncbi:hypothetical protein HNQ34_001765 [Anoxybacillus tepidamans]|uniref:Uncharacterized protein n=1 Tax=Anoxybacteroides tepidamans TaxID=265948 RepID=A0A7W8IRW6_9BACL|nr:hypothetical protein [Anoxybacillus tepidamans]MBB5324667.1 hypothetical protein [Anoxybacillus tepidamans]